MMRIIEELTDDLVMSIAFMVACLSLAAILSGCVSTIYVESDPPGAIVQYKGQIKGKTPVAFDVVDEFGWFSVYSITATLPGYNPQTQTFQEPSPGFAQYIIPPRLMFKLEK